MAQLSFTMRGNLATVFKEKHCYTCHSTEAMGVCAHCGVATYCDAQCAQVGWSDHGHSVTCASYSRLISTVLTASLSAPLSWPAHLESSEERDGFSRFARERSPALKMLAVETALPLYNIDLLLEHTWITLTENMQLKWTRKAKQRGHGTAIDAFTDERKPFMIKDIMDKRSYPNDTLLKQIWRNLIKSERQYFIGGVQKRETPDTKSEEEEEEEREHKRRRLAIDVVSNFLTDHRDGLPTEMIMAIINHLSPKDIVTTALVDKRLNAIVWELLYMIDIVPIMNNTPESKALFTLISTENASFKDRYMASGYMLSKAMANVMIGDMNDENAADDNVPSMRFFLIDDGPGSSPLFEGRTVPKFIMSRSEIEEVYEEYVEQFDVSRADQPGWYDDVIPHDIAGEKRLKAVRELMITSLKATNELHIKLYVSFLLSQKLGPIFSTYYGHPYWSNGICLFSHGKFSYAYSIPGSPFEVVTTAMSNRRFGWNGKSVSRTTNVLKRAIQTFFFDLFMHGHTTMTLTTLYAPSIDPESMDEESWFENADYYVPDDYDNDDDINLTTRKKYARQTTVSFLTGANEEKSVPFDRKTTILKRFMTL
jgi:hypothetical protein